MVQMTLVTAPFPLQQGMATWHNPVTEVWNILGMPALIGWVPYLPLVFTVYMVKSRHMKKICEEPQKYRPTSLDHRTNANTHFSETPHHSIFHQVEPNTFLTVKGFRTQITNVHPQDKSSKQTAFANNSLLGQLLVTLGCLSPAVAEVNNCDGDLWVHET